MIGETERGVNVGRRGRPWCRRQGGPEKECRPTLFLILSVILLRSAAKYSELTVCSLFRPYSAPSGTSRSCTDPGASGRTSAHPSAPSTLLEGSGTSTLSVSRLAALPPSGPPGSSRSSARASRRPCWQKSAAQSRSAAPSTSGLLSAEARSGDDWPASSLRSG